MSFHDQLALVQPQVTVRCTIAHKGSSWFSSTIIKCAWEKAYSTCILWCTKFRHRLHGDEKVPYATSLTCIEVMAHVLSSGEKYYERYFVHWFNDMVSWIFTPWKKSQLKQAKKSTLCKWTLWSLRNHNNISASTENILIILKWIWSSELQNYCKKIG